MVQKPSTIHSLPWIIGISSLLVLSIPGFPIKIFASKTLAQEVVSQELQQEELQQLASSISVKVISGSNGGSGVLIAKEGKVYTILTNNHVIPNEQEISIQTNDGKIYQAQRVDINFEGKDIALLQFSSNLNYRIASLSNLSNVARGDEVFIAGFPFRDKTSKSREFIFRTGRISFVLSQSLKAGYQVGYVSEGNAVEKGMSGGAILDKQGKLIGVNGIHANPLWGNPYIYENGETPNEELRNQMSRSNWGVPVEVLAKLAPNYAVGISSEPQPLAEGESVNQVAATTKPDLANKVDVIAKEISVLISWQTPDGLENGSGAIIARDGNTYSVLTAKHVASNMDKGLKLVTHDGQEYQVQNTKNFQGVDLALLQFTSSKSYQVATLGDYHRGLEDQVVFVSGWPQSKRTDNTTLEQNREFNAGYLLGYQSVNLAKEDRSFYNGYGLVYSNFTEIGMSGSPLLDTEGRLIGIHTAAESIEGKESPVNEEKPILNLGYSLGVPIRTFLAKKEQAKIQLNLNQENSAPQRLNSVEQDAIVRALIDLKQLESDANEISWLNYGNKLWRLRQYEESLRAFEKAIAIKSDFYQAWYAHGWTLMRQKNYTEAKKSFRKAIEYIPESDPDAATLAWRQLGDAFWYSGEYNQAVPAFEKAIEYRPDDFILYQWLSDSFLQLGNYQKALEAVNESLKKKSDISHGYLRRSEVFANLQDYEAAFEDIDTALNLEPKNSFHYIRRGRLNYFQGDYEVALADFDKALEIQPDDVYAYAWQGLVYAKQGNKEKFLSNLKEAIRLQPENDSLYTLRGNGYFALGEIDRGIQDYDTAISLNPDLAHQYYYQRGTQFDTLEDYEKAIADYTKAIQLKPNLALYYSNRGNSYAKTGNSELAIPDLERAISLQPKNPNLYRLRGNGYFALGEIDKGIQNYDTAISLNPDSAHRYYNWRGIQFDNLEDYEKAIADYTQAIKLKPDVAIYYLNRGNSYAKAENKEKLIQDYDTAISLNPDSAHKYYNRRGIQFDQLEDYEKAIADYSQAIELKPDVALYYTNRGNSYAKAGNRQNFIQDYDKAISLNPDSAHKYYNLRGRQFHELEDYPNAIADYTQAIQLKPDISEYYSNRGSSYQNAEDFKLAIADFNKAIVIQPNNASAHMGLGQTYVALEAFQEAIDEFDKVLEIEPETVYAYAFRGLSYFILGEYEPAIANYTKAIQIYPKDNNNVSSIYDARGLSHIKVENYDAAMADFNKAIEIKPNNITALENRAKLREQLEDKQGAREDWEKVAELHREQGNIESSQLALEKVRKLQE